MRVIIVPCLQDNYAYLIHAEGSRRALVVDPSEAEPVRGALDAHGLELAGILNTHHHWDHTGGNEELCQAFGELPVYGHGSDAGRIPLLSSKLTHGESFEAAGLAFRALHVPGHTSGAVAYVTGDAVFTGDTLFAAGCGRLFEGTPAQMYESLNEKLGALPDETRVYCGHEYTASNLRFAAHVEPSNADVRAKAERVAVLRERGEPSVPSTIGEERRTNPFMRCESEEIQKSVAERLSGAASPIEVLAAIRAAKDSFK
ncbi:MAG: hydroxyacylglutathione hydrolase [Polyangiaceae bacterium]|nr:hydroxyacylglutathione hydrolase [Polyangiaceae bacterium]MCL4753798.1 hydroxyacylglutathione hydrolase [Myxococcales bacterium]